jgi:hypothetical protein
LHAAVFDGATEEVVLLLPVDVGLLAVTTKLAPLVETLLLVPLLASSEDELAVPLPAEPLEDRVIVELYVM